MLTQTNPEGKFHKWTYGNMKMQKGIKNTKVIKY
jgi:hypothetical protein